MKARTSGFTPCALIPVYNHGSTLMAVASRLADMGLPPIIVDDGSDDETKHRIREVLEALPSARLERRAKNGGKGAAVRQGLVRAAREGFTHALQVDADGQHDLDVAALFLSAGRADPRLLVAGTPIYGSDAPRSRVAGRKITDFWVRVETWSDDIKDAMCGFRLYPVASTLAVLSLPWHSRRMGFDIEVLVRLHWRRTPMLFVPLRVFYPKDGISHFRLVRDNVLISLVHAKLCCGMILRSPLLLARLLGRCRGGRS